MRWQVVVRNSGPAVATNVTVADSAPAGVTFTAATATDGSCAVGSAVSCVLGAVPAGINVTITITGRLDLAFGIGAQVFWLAIAIGGGTWLAVTRNTVTIKLGRSA